MKVTFALLYLCLLVAGVIGYILNIVYVVRHMDDGGSLTTSMVIHLVGLFLFPLGCIMGWVG